MVVIQLYSFYWSTFTLIESLGFNPTCYNVHKIYLFFIVHNFRVRFYYGIALISICWQYFVCIMSCVEKQTSLDWNSYLLAVMTIYYYRNGGQPWLPRRLFSTRAYIFRQRSQPSASVWEARTEQTTRRWKPLTGAFLVLVLPLPFISPPK